MYFSINVTFALKSGSSYVIMFSKSNPLFSMFFNSRIMNLKISSNFFCGNGFFYLSLNVSLNWCSSSSNSSYHSSVFSSISETHNSTVSIQTVFSMLKWANIAFKFLSMISSCVCSINKTSRRYSCLFWIIFLRWLRPLITKVLYSCSASLYWFLKIHLINYGVSVPFLERHSCTERIASL